MRHLSPHPIMPFPLLTPPRFYPSRRNPNIFPRRISLSVHCSSPPPPSSLSRVQRILPDRLRSHITRRSRHRHSQFSSNKVRLLGKANRRFGFKTAVETAAGLSAGDRRYTMHRLPRVLHALHYSTSFSPIYFLQGKERASVVPPKTSAQHVLALPAAQVPPNLGFDMFYQSFR